MCENNGQRGCKILQVPSNVWTCVCRPEDGWLLMCSFQLWASLLRVTFSVGSCEEPGIALWPSHEAFQHDQQHSGWSYVSSVTQGLIITQSHITAGRGLQVYNLCFVIWMRKWNILKYYETAQKNIIFHHPDKIFDHTVIKLQSWEIVELAFYVKYSHS